MATVSPDFQSSIQKLADLAKEKGDDFRIKVMRKSSPAAPLTVVATFDGANVGHFAVPEAWLVPFCGGGPVFVLWAYHASEPNSLVEQVFPPSIVGQIREPDLLAPSREGWNGPATLVAPLPAKPEKPLPLSGVAPLFAVPPGSQSGGAAREAASPAGSPGHSSEADRLHAIQMQMLDQQRRADNERIEKMIEAQAKNADRQIAALMEVVKAAGQRPVEKPVSIVDQIVPLAAAFTPLVTAMMQRSDASAKASLEREARREEREQKSREEASKAQGMLFEKLASGNTETAKVMQSMADVVANSMKAQLQTFATLRELMPGEAPDEGITGIIKAVAPAAAEFFAARAAAQSTPPPQLPPRSMNGNGAQAAQAPASQPAAPAAPATPPAEGEEPLASADPAGLVSEIEEALKAHHDPHELAAGYVEALATNEGFRNTVAQAGGTIALFQSRLGAWVMEPTPAADGMKNGDYLRAVVGALNGAATQRGVRI